MDSGLKQRLIGATVIIALAVIFIPMFFEDKSETVQVSQDIPEPKKIVVATDDIEEKLTEEIIFIDEEPNSEQEEIENIIENEPVTVKVPENGNSEPEATQEEQPVQKTDKENVNNQVAENQPAKQEKNPTQVIVEAPPEKPTVDDKGLPIAWAVQVGSYNDIKNAVSFRDKLREDGYKAYTQDVQGPKGTLTRVLVGPELVRSKAVAIQTQLNKKYKINGLIIRYQQ